MTEFEKRVEEATNFIHEFEEEREVFFEPFKTKDELIQALFMMLDWFQDKVSELKGANERAIKCVNGCEGILDEDLDKFFKWAKNMWFRQEKLVKEEQEKLVKMTDKEKAEYEARREATLDYNLQSLRKVNDVEKIR